MISYKQLMNNLYCDCLYIIYLSSMSVYSNLKNTNCEMSDAYKVSIHDVTDNGIELTLIPLTGGENDYITDAKIIIIPCYIEDYMEHGLNKTDVECDFIYEIDKIIRHRLNDNVDDKQKFISNCLEKHDFTFDYPDEGELSYNGDFMFTLSNSEGVTHFNLSDYLDELLDFCLFNTVSDIGYLIESIYHENKS